MDVIWNLTRACPWDCKICCVSGFHVCNTTEYFVYSRQKEQGEELTLAEKLTVLRVLADKNFDIDFSGGDPLYYDEDLQVVEQATRWLPSKKIEVSMTGSKITDVKLELLKKVGVVEFTLDNLPEVENPFRPRGYNLASMIAMKKCITVGVRTRAVTVLYSTTISQENLNKIYRWLCDNNVPEWELLMFYPVGRAMALTELVPMDSEYLDILKFLRGLRGSTKILFQHSLRVLEGSMKCPAIINSIGILPDGQVIACAWAIGCDCCPFEGFRLGRLPEDDLDEILDKARKNLAYLERAKLCRVIAYVEENIKKEEKNMKINIIKCKSLLTKSKLPESDYCINPYVGCFHGCIYCYSRFMKRFTGHTEKWGQFVDVKVNAPEILEKELSRNPKKGITLLGSVTDAYQPVEKKYKITRALLEVLLKYDFPVSILTKSDLVVRDIDLLKQFSKCDVGFTITTLDGDVANDFEPRSSSPQRRIKALEKLHKAGIRTYSFIGPILPELTDLRVIFKALRGRVDFVMAESLNMKCGNWEDIKKVLKSKYPQLLAVYSTGFDKKYWDQIERQVKILSKEFNIPLKGFYRHKEST